MCVCVCVCVCVFCVGFLFCGVLLNNYLLEFCNHLADEERADCLRSWCHVAVSHCCSVSFLLVTRVFGLWYKSGKLAQCKNRIKSWVYVRHITRSTCTMYIKAPFC